MTIFTYTAIAIVVLILYYFWKQKKIIDALPPGPLPLPLFGNLLQFDRKDMRKTFLQWHKTYGPIFTVWFGTKPSIFITGYELMQEVFVKRGDEFAYRPDAFVFELFSGGKFGITNTNGEMWKEQRRFSLHTLRNFGFGRKIMEDKINVEISKFVNSINREIDATGYGKANFNIKPLLDVCISNVVSSVICGRTYEANDPVFRSLCKSLNGASEDFSGIQAQLLNSWPWLRHIPLFDHFGYDPLMKTINIFMGNLKNELQKRKTQVEEEEKISGELEPTDFASAYWSEMKQRENTSDSLGYFGDWQLTAVCGDIWAAGIQTTVTTLNWALLYLIYYPKVQEKVQQEIDTIVGHERAPNMADKNQMPYTTAVINEVQRVANILAVNLPHTVKHDTTINGYAVARGTIVIPDIAVVHADDAIYENPEQFDPERFLEPGGVTLKKTDHLLPFSLGKRQCMGESLARMELFLIFTALCQTFSFCFVENEQKPTLDPVVGFIAIPTAYKLCAARRNI